MTQPMVRFYIASDRIQLPRYATDGAAGMDLQADIAAPLTLEPGQRALVPTGVAMAIPSGYEGRVCPRSGLAHKHGISIVNAPGVVDSDYRGIVHANLINLGQQAYTISPGDRIAQIVFAPVSWAGTMRVASIEDLGATTRGDGGHGSTGK